jgi:Ni,Fe-hydrogenase I large subunit
MTGPIAGDPLSGMEGHLSIEVDVESGVVSDVRSSAEIFKGWNIVLKERNPLDAPVTVQRICGTCPQSHGYASAICLDDALGTKPPSNGRIIRNLILGSNFIQSHIFNFYHLSMLDYVDIKAVLKYRGSDSRLIKIRDRIKHYIDSGEYYTRSSLISVCKGDYIEDYEMNIKSIDNYLKALEIRRKSNEILCIWGGKMPYIQTFSPGRVYVKPDIGNIKAFKAGLADIQAFINNIYIPDIIDIVRIFPEWLKIGKGNGNFSSCGGFPMDDGNSKYLFDSGEYIEGEMRDFNPEAVTGDARYLKYPAAPDIHLLKENNVYDTNKNNDSLRIKAQGYKEKASETGPLARIIISYMQKSPGSEIKSLVDSILEVHGAGKEILDSTMGRHITRALECKIIADNMQKWVDELIEGKSVYNESIKIPVESEGKALAEVPRGSLGHWMTIKNKKIDSYQVFSPSARTMSSRDDNKDMSTFEQALLGTPMRDPENPIEAVRVVRSFDPCISCIIKTIDKGKEISKFKIKI